MPPGYGYSTQSQSYCSSGPMCMSGIMPMYSPAGPGVSLANYVRTLNTTRTDDGKLRSEWFVTEVVSLSRHPCSWSKAIKCPRSAVLRPCLAWCGIQVDGGAHEVDLSMPCAAQALAAQGSGIVQVSSLRIATDALNAYELVAGLSISTKYCLNHCLLRLKVADRPPAVLQHHQGVQRQQLVQPLGHIWRWDSLKYQHALAVT